MKTIKKSYIFYSIITLLSIAILIFGLIIYFRHIENETNKILENTDTIYTTKNNTKLFNGLKEVNLKNDLTEYLEKDTFESITYKIDNENFYFEVSTYQEDDMIKFEINKIVHKNHNVNAKMHLKGIEKIQYASGNNNDATLLNLITENDAEYLAIIKNTYYFLGSDIEEISFKNGQFYYMSYNSKYRTLDNAISCSNEVKNNIDKFNNSEYYYKYGKINFLTEYYQKLSSKTFTVENRCNELDETNKISEE